MVKVGDLVRPYWHRGKFGLVIEVKNQNFKVRWWCGSDEVEFKVGARIDGWYTCADSGLLVIR